MRAAAAGARTFPRALEAAAGCGGARLTPWLELGRAPVAEVAASAAAVADAELARVVEAHGRALRAAGAAAVEQRGEWLGAALRAYRDVAGGFAAARAGGGAGPGRASPLVAWGGEEEAKTTEKS